MSADEERQKMLYYGVQNMMLLLSVVGLVFAAGFAIVSFAAPELQRLAVNFAVLSLLPALVGAFLERVVTLADLSRRRSLPVQGTDQ